MDSLIRKLASIQMINSVTKHPNADRLDICNVLGWHVITRHDEFVPGDLAVYFETDSLIPESILKQIGLWDIDKNKGKLNGTKGNRLKTVKIRSLISQGLAIPLTTIFPKLSSEYDEGSDVTEFLGVTKYEPLISPELQGQVRGNFPGFLKKTDTHRLQAHPRVIDELKACEEIYMTIKYDGTSFTAFNRVVDIGSVDPPLRGNDFGVCSRNINLKDTETNTYWRMARKYNFEEILKDKNRAIQAEIVGPGIQKNRMGLSELQIGVFDVFDIKGYTYFNLDDLVLFCDLHKLPMVKLIYRGVMKWDTVDELIELANEQRYPNGKQAEGIIIRPCVEKSSERLEGRLAVKVISPKYLLEHGE